MSKPSFTLAAGSGSELLSTEGPVPDHATPGGHEPAALQLGKRRARLTARLAEIGVDAAPVSSADIGALGLIEEMLDKVPRANRGPPT
jgi:hypothetical protein